MIDARATLRGTVIDFHPDWPRTTGMDADVAFIGNGFSVGSVIAITIIVNRNVRYSASHVLQK
jgi:uncharacterized protein YhdP